MCKLCWTLLGAAAIAAMSVAATSADAQEKASTPVAKAKPVVRAIASS